MLYYITLINQPVLPDRQPIRCMYIRLYTRARTHIHARSRTECPRTSSLFHTNTRTYICTYTCKSCVSHAGCHRNRSIDIEVERDNIRRPLNVCVFFSDKKHTLHGVTTHVWSFTLSFPSPLPPFSENCEEIWALISRSDVPLILSLNRSTFFPFWVLHMLRVSSFSFLGCSLCSLRSFLLFQCHTRPRFSSNQVSSDTDSYIPRSWPGFRRKRRQEGRFNLNYTRRIVWRRAFARAVLSRDSSRQYCNYISHCTIILFRNLTRRLYRDISNYVLNSTFISRKFQMIRIIRTIDIRKILETPEISKRRVSFSKTSWISNR